MEIESKSKRCLLRKKQQIIVKALKKEVKTKKNGIKYLFLSVRMLMLAQSSCLINQRKI